MNSQSNAQPQVTTSQLKRQQNFGNSFQSSFKEGELLKRGAREECDRQQSERLKLEVRKVSNAVGTREEHGLPLNGGIFLFVRSSFNFFEDQFRHPVRLEARLF